MLDCRGTPKERIKRYLETREYFEQIGEGSYVESANVLLGKLRDSLLNQLFFGKISSSNFRERIELASLTLKIDQALLAEELAQAAPCHGKQGCKVPDIGPTLLARLDILIKEVKKGRSLPHSERLSAIRQIARSLALYRPLTNGNRPILSSREWQQRLKRLEDISKPLFQEIIQVSSSPLKRGTHRDFVIEKVPYRSVKSLPGIPFQREVKYGATALNTGTPSPRPSPARGEGVKIQTLSADLWNRMRSELEKKDGPDLRLVRGLNEEGMKQFIQEVNNTDQFYQKAKVATGEERVKKLLSTAENFAKLGLKSRVQSILKPLLQKTDSKKLSIPQQAQHYFEIAKVYHLAGMKKDAKAVLAKIQNLPTQKLPPPMRHLTQLARAMSYLIDEDLDRAKKSLAKIYQHPMA
jgi:hypothetical protein